MPESVLDSSLPENHCFCPFAPQVIQLIAADSIRSTKLRKHIAIMSQLLCLKDNELDLLAGYMGHDVRIHREFYRLTENTLQLAKVSKLLIMMERGLTSEYKGKSLEEIDFNLDESWYYFVTVFVSNLIIPLVYRPLLVTFWYSLTSSYSC